jgi:hypothetical protein
MHKRSTPPGPPHRPDADVLSSSLPRGASDAAGTHVHEIGADGARRIMSAAEAAGVTLAVVLCAAFARLFGTLGGESEILMDVPAALGACGFRPGAARRAVTMALSSAANGRDFIAQVSNALLSAASTPSALVPGKSAKAIRFDFSGEAGGPAAAADPPAAPPFDVSLHVTEKPDRLRLELTYATDALTPDTAARWCGHYETLLDGLAADPDAPLAELPLLTPDEAAALARLGNDTDAGLPEG